MAELEAGPSSQVLYPMWPAVDSALPTLFPAGREKNPFDPSLIWVAHPQRPEHLLHCNRTQT